jgi:hypothetical protein
MKNGDAVLPVIPGNYNLPWQFPLPESIKLFPASGMNCHS